MGCKVVAAKGGGYNIVEPGGKVVGHSDTLPKAQASARKRNEAGDYQGKKKPDNADSD